MSTRKRGEVENKANGVKKPTERIEDPRTDRSRWRMVNDRGEQTWTYLKSEEQAKQWPQTDADKWYLGLNIVCLHAHLLAFVHLSEPRAGLAEVPRYKVSTPGCCEWF